MQTKKYKKYSIISTVLLVLSLFMLILSNRKDDTFITSFLVIGLIF